MSPHRFTSGEAIGADDLFVSTLLLRISGVAPHREGRPPRSDWPPPEQDGRRDDPIRFYPYARNRAIAISTAKPGPANESRCGLDCRGCPRRARRGGVDRWNRLRL